MSSGLSENHREQQRCGEIFMTTTERNLVFHCTLCEMKYNGFSEYVDHLDEHFPGPDVFHIEEVEVKYEEPHQNIPSPHASLVKEMETDIKGSEEASKRLGDNESATDITHVKASESSSNTDEPQQNDIKEESSRPVRLRTMYFQQPGEIRKFKCSLCSAAFKDKGGLKKHVQRHKSKKSHQCPHCPKKFYAAIEVKTHLRSHTGDRPFLCTICGKTCLSNVKLKDHMRRHTNQRDYKCPYCEKTFYNSNLLTGHMPVHVKERQHKCDVCNRNFVYRKGLRNHMKLHENKRDYKCDLCSAAFNQQAGLFGHMKTKHKTV